MILDLEKIIKKYELKINGVIHVGAYAGEESFLYRKLGIIRAIFFEPQKHLYEITKQRAQGYHVFNIGLGNSNTYVDLNISHTHGGVSNGCGASSSILEPKKHLEQYPHITFGQKERIEIRRLDDFLQEQKIKSEKYNLMNIDVQGYELEVLKGSVETLPYIDGIICEVNREELYKECPMVEEIDKFLSKYGFVRKETDWIGTSWGDAYYGKI